MHLIMNAYWEPLDFELPAPEGDQTWRRWIDTSLESPDDIMPWQDAPLRADRAYHTAARSVVVLWAPLTGSAQKPTVTATTTSGVLSSGLNT
jgi:glycogen operon protein